MTASLTLTYGALNLTATPYLIDFGTDTGAPQNEAVALPFIQDGEIELSSRAGNRTITFDVLIEGASLTALATAEANLVAESEKVFNTLTVDPGDSAPAAVYDIFRGQISLVRDDSWEIARMRRYTITVRALPYPRSATETTTAALPTTGATTTLLDACSATTGWTGFVDGAAVTPATAGGAVTLTASVAKGSHTYALQKTFAATTTSTKFLAVIWTPPPANLKSTLTATGDGVSLPLVAEIPSGVAGKVKSYFNVAASSLAVTRLEWTGYADAAASVVLSIDNVDVTNVNPIIGTARQQLRSVTVSGSARTQGSLAVESATAALGDGTQVYVYPRDDTTNGYSAPMRQFRSSGNAVTPDAALVSGNSEPLTGSAVTFLVPIGLFPRGQYLLVGRLATSGGGTPTITYTCRTDVGVGFGLGTVSGTRAITTTTAYQNFTLGRLSLPTVDLDPLAQAAGVTMSLSISSSTTCTYDEVWLFNTTIGALIAVDCGTGAGSVGGTSRRLFIEAPTVTTPRPTVRIGHNADRSDSHYPVSGVTSWMFPEFKPPQVNVLTVTPNATDTTVALRHFPRWHTNPAA